MTKVLLTGGCSFSVAKNNCWPMYLENMIQPIYSVHTGASCQGNDLISKKILYQLIKLLSIYNTSDLLVGIMWSGTDRKAIYLETPDSNLPKLKGCPDNPNAVVDNHFNWYMLNSVDGKQNKFGLTNLYYKNLYSITESYISTIEHILRVQWFLEKNNINYFMSTYTNQVLPVDIRNITEIKYLYDQINFDKFLPVEGEFEWCKKFYEDKFLPNDNHPTTEQHKYFVEQVIYPFLEKNNYV